MMNPDQRGTNHLMVVLVCCVATIGGFLFGFDSGVINGTVKGLQAAFESDSIGTGFNVASMLLGCAAGAFFAGRLADIYGRRGLLLAAAVLFLISAWGSGVAGSSFEFVIYRVIGGMAVGAASVMAPAYISEITPADYRGRMTSVQQVAIICGLTGAFVSNFFLAKYAGASTDILWWDFPAWRWMFWAEMIPAAIFFGALLMIPESPRYLVAAGKADRSRAVLARIFGAGAADAKVREIKASLVADHRPRFRDLLERARATGGMRVRPIVLVGIGLAIFQQFVGINVVFYYGAVLWQAVGFSEADSLLINILSGSISIAACIVTMLLIDRIGRKPILLVGSVGMAVCLSAMVLGFTGAERVGDELVLAGGMDLLVLAAANLYVMFFNFSWGPVMWVMLGEMFPNQIRGSGLAVAGLFQWLANFAVTMTFPIFLAGIGLAGAYGLYSIAAFLSLLFVWRAVRETRGIELEAMPG